MARNKKNFRKNHRGHYKKSFIPYPFVENEELTVEVESLTSMGQGVTRVDHTPTTGDPVHNWVIFIPFALPGETIKIKVVENSKNNSSARIIEVIEPSEDRVDPQCKHFFHCGGCQYQHHAYSKQLEIQTQHISEQLKRIAGIEHSVEPAIPSPKIWNYRSKITPHYKKPVKGKIQAIGFLHHTNKNQLIDLQSCAIAMDELNTALPAIKKHTQGHARTIKEDGTLLMRVNDGSIETSKRNAVKETVQGIDFHFLAGDFFQNNPYILGDFTSYVADQASHTGLNFLVDAYCGCGLFALTLANKFEQVAGVEVSETSTDWARYNAERNDLNNVRFHAGSAEEIFKAIEFPANQTAMVVDPPRAGCNKKFLDQLFTFRPERVVYVSCDPSTQMRDLKEFLDNGYTVRKVQPIDLFPHTRHLECVITLDRA